AIAAALTRTAGVVLLPALFLYWLVNRRYRWATYLFFAGSLTVGVWLAWTFLAPEPEFRRLYVADLGLAGRRESRLQLLQNTLVHLPDRTRHMVTVVIPFVLALPVIGDTIVDNVLWMLVTVSIGVTGVILLVRRWQIAAFVLVFYAALLFVWRYALERFASPLVPFLLVALALGADWLTRRFTPRWRGALMGTLVALLAFGALRVNVLRAEKNLGCDRGNLVDDSGCWDSYARAYLQAALWVRDSTPATALFFVNKERGFYMHSQRKTINQDRALQEDSLSLAAYLRARGAEYTVAAQVGVRSDKHNVLLASACRDFVVLKQFPRLTAVLRLRNADDPPDDGRACRVLSPYRGRTREPE
ncbi:MAG: hypothetical protein ABIZ91_05580, partial [Gemmatimonadaceae bacterium]